MNGEHRLAAILAIGCASAVAQRDWVRLRDPEGYAPIVCDAARGRLVVFGGGGSEPVNNRTFEWDAVGGWQQRLPAVAPPPRWGQAMVYDATRRRVVVFGGVDDVQFLGDTWEWDGSAWTQRTLAQSPPARVGAAIAYDRLRQRIVLFGGRRDYSTTFGDTWEWDGVNWVNCAPATAPSARSYAAMAFDPRNRRVLLFGGYDAQVFVVPETWLWDGVRWGMVQTAARPADVGVLAEDPVRARLLFVEAFSNVDWEWDGRNWSRPPAAAGPRPVYLDGLAFDSASGHPIASTGDGELWQFLGGGWRRLAAKQPLALDQYEMCTDYTTGRVLAFGTLQGSAFGTFELRDGHWSECLSTTPTPALSYTMATGDLVRGRIVAFGGMDPTAVSDQTFEWDGSSWRAVSTTVRPPGRYGGRLVYDIVGARVLLFGGDTLVAGPQRLLDDTWAFNGLTWTQLQPSTRPAGRVFHAMAADILRGRIALFGGNTAVGLVGDTWEWIGSNWQLVATAGPSAREGSACDYDLQRGRVVLFGGSTFAGVLDDTWEWNGQLWTQLAVATRPPGSEHPHIAFDVATGEHVLGPGITCTRPIPCVTHLASWRLAIPLTPGATSFGTGCGGSGGVLTLGSDAPYLGNAAFSFDVRNAPPGAPCAVVLSTVQQTTLLGSGCTAYVGAPFADVLFATADAAGVARARIAVPAELRLVGATPIAQAGALDPQGPLGGLAISDARQLTIGR